MTITLPPDLDERLSEEARQRGTTPELLAVDGLRRLFLAPAPEGPTADGSLLDFLGDFVGSIDGPPDVPARDSGRLFAEGVEEKHRQGRP